MWQAYVLSQEGSLAFNGEEAPGRAADMNLL